MKTISLQKYIDIYNNSRQIYELEKWGTQCVAQVKHYSKLVLGIKLGTFGSSAYKGWLNKSNTFKKEIWRKVKNDLSNPNQVPPAGAIGFMKPTRGNPYGHTFTIIKAEKGKNYFEVFEQNVGNGNGKGYDDRAKKGKYRYNTKFLGWYEKIEKHISVEKIVEKADDLLKEVNKSLQKKVKELEKQNTEKTQHLIVLNKKLTDTKQILERVISDI